MIKPQSKKQPKWTDVKAKLASFDRAGLLGLVQDLYAAHSDNRTFLHTRLGLGENILEPYKQTIDRWLWPDAFRKQDTSVAKAKQAISNYKQAVADSAGLAELMAFYCEQASPIWRRSAKSRRRAAVGIHADSSSLAYSSRDRIARQSDCDVLMNSLKLSGVEFSRAPRL